MGIASRAFRAAMFGGLTGIGLGTCYTFIRVVSQPSTLTVPEYLVGAPVIAGIAALFVLPAMLLIDWPLAAVALAQGWSMSAMIAACFASATASLTALVFMLGLQEPGTMAGEGSNVAATFVAAAIPFAVCTAGGLAWAIGQESRVTPPVPQSE